MQVNQVTDDRQAQTETALRTRRRAVGLPEAIKNVGNKFWWNADAGISHRDGEVRILMVNLHRDRAAFGCEFDGVAEKIPEDLLQTIWIAHHRKGKGTKIGL